MGMMLEKPVEITHILLRALKLYQQGRSRETADLCRDILKSTPDEPNALHLLGVVQLMNGEARSRNTTSPDCWANLANGMPAWKCSTNL
jgi:hypothetical protein